MKPVAFLGNALDSLRAFPVGTRREAGHQLHQLQVGLDPDDWKPISTIGPGVREIRIRDASGAYRILYVTNRGDAIYVLHCFQKKEQQISKADLNLAQIRYRELPRSVNP